MIVLKLMDGLGNQMFQYAFARYLQEKYNEEIVFETSKLNKNAIRKYGLDKFSISTNIRMANKFENFFFKIYSKLVRIFSKNIIGISQNSEHGYHKMINMGFYTTEEPIKYFEFKYSKLPVKFIRGYFQSEKYFKDIKEIIKSEFSIKTPIDEASKNLIEELNNCESICVHIRRGDYIGNEKYEVCSEEYYRASMNYFIRKFDNPIFYIFSNCEKDLEWIKNNYNIPGKKKYVNIGKDEFDDLRFMYNCKHYIISNSTFSWWGSYLSKNNDSVIIAPSKWYNTNEDTKDIYCDNWNIFDIETGIIN